MSVAFVLRPPRDLARPVGRGSSFPFVGTTQSRLRSGLRVCGVGGETQLTFETPSGSGTGVGCIAIPYPLGTPTDFVVHTSLRKTLPVR